MDPTLADSKSEDERLGEEEEEARLAKERELHDPVQHTLFAEFIGLCCSGSELYEFMKKDSILLYAGN